jgi:hypothetical protein
LGRPKGSLNKSTRDIKALAQKHTPAALSTLVSIMARSDSDAARVAAAKELLDRGYGKSHQTSDVKVETTRYVVEMPTPSKDTGTWLEGHGPPVH